MAPVPPRERLLTPRFLLVVASGLCYFMAVGMLIPVVPQYVKGPLGGGNVGVGVAVGSLFVGAVLLRPYAGRVGDRFGRRVLIIGGALIVAVTTAFYGAVDALPYLVLIRLLSGIGEAAFFVGAATMITDLAPEHRRGEAVSYWSVAVYGGLAFGPALGETVLGDDRFVTAWAVSASLALLAAVLGTITVETARRVPPEPSGKLLHRAALAPGTVLFLGLIGLAGFTAFVPLYVRELDLGGADWIFLLYGGLILCVRIVGARLPDALGGRVSATIALSCGARGAHRDGGLAEHPRARRRHGRFRSGHVAPVPGADAARAHRRARARARLGRRDLQQLLRPLAGPRRVDPGRRGGARRLPGSVRRRRDRCR